MDLVSHPSLRVAQTAPPSKCAILAASRCGASAAARSPVARARARAPRRQLLPCSAESAIRFRRETGSRGRSRPRSTAQTEILPKYFRHSRFQSLVRQLNFYSFKKISKERSVCIYQHALFLRDRPDQLEHLKRSSGNL